MKKEIKLTTDVKKQHTVPRFLLDKFGVGKKGKKRKLFTFDKSNGRTFQQSVFDATTRNSFYNIEGHPEQASLEPILGIYENQASPIIKKIIEEKNIANLTNDERFKIATFIAVQRARSYGELLKINGVMNALSEKLSAFGATDEQIEAEIGSEESPERKNQFFKLILDQKDVVEHLLQKSWILYETDENDPFFISDNPVTLHNSIDMGPWGNLGIGLKGIQIHLPISSTLTLALTCPSISEPVIAAKHNVLNLMASAPQLLTALNKPLDIIKYGDAYEKGIPLRQTSENVRFLNSLQVMFGEQYIFCEKNNFHLAEEMIANNDVYRAGMRMQVN